MSSVHNTNFKENECETLNLESRIHLIQEAKLEEYKTLRQEILDMEKIQHEITLFIFTGVSAIYALAFNSNELYLLFISYIILIPLRCRHIFYHEMVTKAATYIQIFIEKDIEGLNWETNTHKDKADDRNADNEFRPVRLHYYVYSIIAWGTFILISLHTIMDCRISEYIKPFIIVASMLLSFLVSRYDLLLLQQSDSVRNYYEEAWNGLKIKTK